MQMHVQPQSPTPIFFIIINIYQILWAAHCVGELELDTFVVYRDPITFNKHVISVNLLVQM